MGNKTDRAKGGAKRAAGAVTGDAELKEQGRRDQAKGNAKAGAKKVKEAVKKLRRPSPTPTRRRHAWLATRHAAAERWTAWPDERWRHGAR